MIENSSLTQFYTESRLGVEIMMVNKCFIIHLLLFIDNVARKVNRLEEIILQTV